MPSIYAQYNEEVVQAHREALQALRELLAEETDPAERRKLANAILRARPAKDPKAEAAPTSEQPAPIRTGTVNERTDAPTPSSATIPAPPQQKIASSALTPVPMTVQPHQQPHTGTPRSTAAA